MFYTNLTGGVEYGFPVSKKLTPEFTPYTPKFTQNEAIVM